MLHDILHYVDKDDPAGPVPLDPSKDEQYVPFEQGVVEWSKRQKLQGELAPDGEDDVHVLQNAPMATILEPEKMAKVSSGVMVKVEAKAPRGVISRVEILLDGLVLRTIFQAPYETMVPLGNVKAGFQTLTARAYDDVDNQGEAEVTVNVVR